MFSYGLRNRIDLADELPLNHTLASLAFTVSSLCGIANPP